MSFAKTGIRLAAAMIVVIIGLILGIAAGHIYQAWRHDAEQSELRVTQQLFLEQNIQGIEVGRPFPDVPFEDTTGQLRLTRDFLSNGGILVYTAADCGACLEAMSALCAAIRRAGTDSHSVLIVASGDLTPLRKLVAQESPNLTILSDGQHALAEQYGVLTFPCAFLLDSMQFVQVMEAGIRTEDDFYSLLGGK